MHIFVTGAEAGTLSLDVAHNTTIHSIKQMIESRTNMSSKSQMLSYGAKPLGDALTVGDYNMTEDATLILSGHLLGGAGALTAVIVIGVSAVVGYVLYQYFKSPLGLRACKANVDCSVSNSFGYTYCSNSTHKCIKPTTPASCNTAYQLAANAVQQGSINVADEAKLKLAYGACLIAINDQAVKVNGPKA